MSERLTAEQINGFYFDALTGRKPLPDDPSFCKRVLIQAVKDGTDTKGHWKDLLSISILSNSFMESVSTLTTNDIDWIVTQGVKARKASRTAENPEDLDPRKWGKPATMADLLEPLPERKWLIQDLLYTGAVSIWHAPPGLFKSMLLMDMAVCIASGYDWLVPRLEDQLLAEKESKVKMGTVEVSQLLAGRKTEQAKVLWLDFDQGRDRVQERASASARAYGIDQEQDLPLVAYTMPRPALQSDNAEMMEALQEMIIELGAEFVIVDTLSTTSSGVDENTTAMQTVMLNWRNIAEHADCHVALIHHDAKHGDYRGSTAIDAGVDLRMKLSVDRDKDPKRVEISCQKTRGALVGSFAVKFDYDNFPDTKILERAQFYPVQILRPTDDTELVYQIIERGGGDLTQSMIINTARADKKISRPRAESAITKLRSAERIQLDTSTKGRAKHWTVINPNGGGKDE